MNFIDLQAQYQAYKDEMERRIAKVLDSSCYIKGQEVQELEQKLAAYVGAKHCIGVANGTDALLIAMMALGVGPGDEVIVPDFTFVAPAEMVLCLGATPVFADIDPKTYNLAVDSLQRVITPATKAIIPVSLYGQCADIDAINELAANHNIPVIEDAAQSFGATYKERYSCNLTTIATTSFFPSKPLGCYGDGGACFTNDADLATIIASIANHGQDGRYNHVRLGVNSRLDTLQAAVLLVKLAHFPEEVERRVELAAKYTELLQNHLQVPYIESYNSSAFAQYTVEVNARDKVINHLQQQGIPTAVHYPKSLHQQPAFAEVKITTELTNAVVAANRVVSLPFSAFLPEDDLQMVVKHLIGAIQ